MRTIKTAAIAAALACAGCSIATADPAGTGADSDAILSDLDALTIAAEQATGYDRDLFSDWTDPDGNGCDTRYEVLLAEDRSGDLTTADCGHPMNGEWISAYDGEVVTYSSDLDIDHMVPLSEAWASGARDWTGDRRADYATNLDDPAHLIAVTAASNRSKSDQDPAEWMPSDESTWCTYIADWTRIKHTWGLTVDQGEHDAIAQIAADC